MFKLQVFFLWQPEIRCFFSPCSFFSFPAHYFVCQPVERRFIGISTIQQNPQLFPSSKSFACFSVAFFCQKWHFVFLILETLKIWFGSRLMEKLKKSCCIKPIPCKFITWNFGWFIKYKTSANHWASEDTNFCWFCQKWGEKVTCFEKVNFSKTNCFFHEFLSKRSSKVCSLVCTIC